MSEKPFKNKYANFMRGAVAHHLQSLECQQSSEQTLKTFCLQPGNRFSNLAGDNLNDKGIKSANVSRGIAVPCSQIVAGKLGTTPIKVHFNENGLYFLCPDYYFGKLYKLVIKYTDIESIKYYFGEELKAIFIYPLFVFKKLAARFLCHPHGESGFICPDMCDWCKKKSEDLPYPDIQVIILNFEMGVSFQTLKQIVSFIPKQKLKSVNVAQAFELQKKNAVLHQANKKNMTSLLEKAKTETPRAIINRQVLLRSSDMWEDPYPGGSYLNRNLGRSKEYLNQNSKGLQETKVPSKNRSDQYFGVINQKNSKTLQESKVPSKDRSDQYCSLLNQKDENEDDSDFQPVTLSNTRTRITELKTPPKSKTQPSCLRRSKRIFDNDVPIKTKVKKGTLQYERISLDGSEDGSDTDKQGNSSSQHSVDDKYYVIYPPPPEIGIVVSRKDLDVLEEFEWLNDVIIDFWLNYLYCSRCSEEERTRVYFFSTFFCTVLSTQNRTDSLLSDEEERYLRTSRWTKKVDIFQKEFLLFPVNESHHWYLIIVCYPGDVQQHEDNPVLEKITSHDDSLPSADSEEPLETSSQSTGEQMEEPTGMLVRRPYILVLDSLGHKRRKTVQDLKKMGLPLTFILILVGFPSQIRHPFGYFSNSSKHYQVFGKRNFLELESKHRRELNIPFNDTTIPTVCLNVPEQQNGYDCGIFLLQYVETFCQTLLKQFEVPLTSFNKWFPENMIKSKRKEILRLLKQIHDEQEQAGVLSVQPGAMVAPYRDIFSP